MTQDLKNFILACGLDLLHALFDCLVSPSPILYETVSNSLNTLGNKQPALFLTVTHGYLLQHNKLADNNRSFILNAITKVLDGPGVLEECDEQQALLIINLATHEMTMTKDNEEEWANAARDMLVTLAKSDRFIGHVMDAVLKKYPPGHTVSPHKYLVLTMAAIAKHNPAGFRPFLADILSRTVQLLGHLKQYPIRSAWSQALCCFCEAVMECSTVTSSASASNNSTIPVNNDDSLSTVTKSDFGDTEYSDLFESIYEFVFNWTSSKDSKCRADAVECIGALCQMIPRQKVGQDLMKIIVAFLAMYKKTTILSETCAIAKGIANFLSVCCSEDTFNVEQYLDDIFNAFFPHVCVVTEHSLSEDVNSMSVTAMQIKIRNEAFRCFQIASRRFADRQVYYLLHKMQNDKDSVKLGATNLMRHLLNSAGSQMEDKRSLITMGLKPLLTDETLSVRVKMSICQLCVALADHGYVHAEVGGQQVIQFLLTNLVLKVDPLTTNKKLSAGDNVSLSHLHSQCAQALHTIANTRQSSFNLLWPVLFEYICQESYNGVITDILKCIRILTYRAREDGLSLDFNFESNERMATPHQVMSRLFICMNGAPLNSTIQKRATEALKVFDEICVWFSKLIPNVVKEQLPQILALAEDTTSGSDKCKSSQHNTSYQSREYNCNTTYSHHSDYSSLELKCARMQRWQVRILEFLNACVCAENESEWRQELATAMADQFHLYNDNSHEKAFLMRCLAQTLSRISNTTFVVEKMTLMFDATTHSNQIERVGCAMAVGHCAQTHTKLMLSELAHVSRGDTKKSSAGLLSFIKDAMPYGKTTDIEMIHLKATLVLCYGYIVYFCPIESVVQHVEETVLPFLRQYVENCKDVVMREAHLETINLIALTVHPQHLNYEYTFDLRYECFTYIKRYVQAENPETLSSWVRLLAAKATASLAQLEPAICENELCDIGAVLTQHIFPISREKAGLKTLDPLSVSGFLLSPLISTSHLPSGVAGNAVTYPHENCVFGFGHCFQSAFPSHRATSSTAVSSLMTRSLDRAVIAECSTDVTERPRLSSTFTKGETKKHKSSLSAMANAVTNGLSGGDCDKDGDKSSASQTKVVTGTFNVLRIDDDEASTVMDAIVMQYRNAIGQIVTKRPFVTTVEHFLKMYSKHYGSTADHERTRSIDSTCLVLTVYAETAADCILGRASDFPPLPNLLGRLAPRLSDSLYAVRILSIRAIWLAFKLSLMRRGHSPDDTDLVDSALFDPNAFIDEYLGNEGKIDVASCRSVTAAISKEIGKRLPQSQMQAYISALLTSLSDRQNNVSNSAAQLFNIVMEDILRNCTI